MVQDWGKLTRAAYIDYGHFESGEEALIIREKEAFHSDEARILTSSAFRRLQGKTQVYPLPNNDFVRNRLTHTMEVAFVARAIARNLLWRLRELQAQGYLSNLDNIDVIVNASCLIHDLGNPPFGHSGEDSIKKFFLNAAQKYGIVDELKAVDELYSDFTRFDGNAQGFRMAVKSCGRRYFGGLRLSSPVLASFVKYPHHSSCDFARDEEKFGYFRTEEKYFQQVFSTGCGLNEIPGVPGKYEIHPFASLLEAADDISYLTSDVEDAFRNGDLSTSETRAVLRTLCEVEQLVELGEFEASSGEIHVGLEDEAISYYRFSAVENCISSVVTTYTNILKGLEERDPSNATDLSEKIGLLGLAGFNLTERAIRRLSDKRIYTGRRKMALQVAGGKILGGILRVYMEILDRIFTLYQEHEDGFLHINQFGEELTFGEVLNKSLDKELRQTFELLPSHCKNRIEDVVRNRLVEELREETNVTATARLLSINECIHVIVDFISGMSDEYAVRYYNNITYIDNEDRGGPY